MAGLKSKIEELLATAWHTAIDTQICNEFMKQRKDMGKDLQSAQAYINDFCNNNRQLISLCSNEFRNMIEEIMTMPINESLNEQNYDGYWEDTTLKVSDLRGHKLLPDVVKALRAMALEYYGVKLLNPEDPSLAGFALIVAKIPLTKALHFRNDCKSINKNIVASPYIEMKRTFNIANKVNKAFAKKEKEMQESTIFEKAVKLLTENDCNYNTRILQKLVDTDPQSVKDVVTEASAIDAHRLSAMLEVFGIKENDTADINVPDRIAFAGAAKKRLMNFDPYGSVSNVSPGSRSVMKFAPDTFKESIRNIKVSSMTVIGSDMFETNLHSNVIVESAGEKSQITFDKKDFTKFVLENTDCNQYVAAGNLDLSGYLKNRPHSFLTTLFREYFDRKLNEDIGSTDFTVEDINIDVPNDAMRIDYFYPGDEHVRTVETSAAKFVDFVAQNDFNFEDFTPSGEGNDPEIGSDVYSKFTEYWDMIHPAEQLSLVRSFMIQSGTGNMNESANSSERVSDYNNWKAMVATVSNNDFELRNPHTSTGGNVSALDANGNTIGTWDSNNNTGYVRK